MRPDARMLLRGFVLWLSRRLGQDLDPVSPEGALRRARARHGQVGTVIDIGASDGRWTRICLPFFPEADYLLIEASAQHEQALQRLSRQAPRVHYLIAAAGDAVGQAHFGAAGRLGGRVWHAPLTSAYTTVVPMTTVDEERRARQLRPPFLLKLDTHGFEVPILEGAAKTLASTEILIVETYNFELKGGTPRFAAMNDYIEGKGFRCVDLIWPLHRPHDEVLWQFDLVFARADHPVFSHQGYK
jgi:FkbM family methyltransferase